MKRIPPESSSISALFLSLCCLLLLRPCAIRAGSRSRILNDESSEELFSRGQSRGNYNGNGNGTDVGLSPPVGNLAANAIIVSNATCGQTEPETYCKLVEHVNVRSRPSQCQICDAHSSDKAKRHPITHAIDGSSRWWQSPTLQNGKKYEWVTITIDLRQVYQVAYIVLKAALSPRPGNWILEKSMDGVNFLPWQYYAITDEECLTRYGIVAKPGKPSYNADNEVICTSYFSKITPFEGGEIHTSLVNGRPGAEGPTEELVKFTVARFVRLRFQKIRTLHADLMGGGGNLWDKTVWRRYFYSIKDIAIGGHCVCFGHSSECVKQGATNTESCMCQHNTCGEQCDMCCPLYNQYEWGPGNSTASAACEQCQCYGRADSCVYDPEVHAKRLSINMFGTYDGGGYCIGCKAHTTGVNCERCVQGYYRPHGVRVEDPNPCVRCECSGLVGSTGTCYTGEDHMVISDDKIVGDCICKEGFTGKYCDECSPGYRGFPKCVLCPCNLAGILNQDCEGDCICKKNVEGQYCSSCKPGFYNLDGHNPEGCTQCFCHGVTSICQSSNYTLVEYSNNETWVVTDLHGTKVLQAIQVGDTFHIANEEFSNYDRYYWTSEEYFSGSNIDSYGLELTFHVSWVQARGDTSGRPIPDFDVVIQGVETTLAFNYRIYDGNNATISVTLDEHDCFVLPDMDNQIGPRNEAQREMPCTRYDIMEALSDIKQILLRAKYHTDQIEGMLHYAFLEKADSRRLAGPSEPRAVSIEVCACPKGYIGDSCEECSYGYRRSSVDSWLNECTTCNCNGHARSCDMIGECYACEHNTTGVNCHQCADGFYGDPTTEHVNSCKPCECPLAIASNNFSPTCAMSGNSYACTACQIGYEGPYCERCSNGYFGNPTEVGGSCKPCSCSGAQLTPTSRTDNICDQLTGECFVCPKYTVGWNCDECLEGYFGNPLNGSCVPCSCDRVGSSVTMCHYETGQCSCNDRFTGRTCNECVPGCGNRAEGCPTCNCDPNGSQNAECDQITGQCFCKVGVGGRYCNQCVDLHYGFSSTGCKTCDCHPEGSDSALCDLVTGQCHCLKNVVNRRCDACLRGYWNIRSGQGCERCNCDPVGAENNNCDPITGQCFCKPGVGGFRCEECLSRHFGFSSAGCKACDPCDTLGHVCDLDTGRCVCPANSEGAECSKCTVGNWGHPVTGCRSCNCSQQGSSSQHCASDTGKCPCALGYDGDKCDKCKFGYFNYPNCAPCDCDLAGTDGTFCASPDTCSCDQYGQCPCKDNVIGLKCDRCKEGAYSLEKLNPTGCTECFCFQRTNKCSQGYFKWQRLALPNEREVVTSWQSKIRLSVINNLIVIPESGNDVLIDKDVSFSSPLYWQLPHIFLGDKVLSYDGFLRFRTMSNGATGPFPAEVFKSYPLVQMQGNHRLVLEHFPGYISPTGYYEVRLHEDQWRLKHGPSGGRISKEIMMVALQNLQHILIRGTNSPEIIKATLFNVSLDIAIPAVPGEKSLVHGVEVCDCPPEYNSTSCQNPKIGYYRWYKKEYITSTVIIDLVGQAKRCECNGRSSVCDTETGFCQKCADNTGGRYCEQCANGYYGNPFDRCLPCPCPTVWHSHASSCNRLSTGLFQCFCEQGYTGKSCERCDYGYFGNPERVGGYCEPCQCNQYGSVSDECDEITGQCNCRPGISGRDCSKCSVRHVIIGKTCTSCDDACTGKLLNDFDAMMLALSRINISAADVSVLKMLLSFEKESLSLLNSSNSLEAIRMFIDDLPTERNLASIMLARANELESNCRDSRLQSLVTKQEAARIHGLAELLSTDIKVTILLLRDFMSGRDMTLINPNWALEEVDEILEALEVVSLKDIKEEARAELEDSKAIYQKVLDIMFGSFNVSQTNITERRDRLDDLKQYISQTFKDISQTERIISTAREWLGTGKANAGAIESAAVEMDVQNMMSLDLLNRGSFVMTEIKEVLMMSEDIMRDLRNITKEMEIKENNLYELVPLYRVKYAQPAFDHVEVLKEQAAYLEGLFRYATSNSSRSIQAATAYDRMKDAFNQAYGFAKNASEYSQDTSMKIQRILGDYSLERMMEDSTEFMNTSKTLLEIVDKSMRTNLNDLKESIEALKWKLKAANESLRVANNDLDYVLETRRDLHIPELINHIDETLDFWDETSYAILETETRIRTELRVKLDNLERLASFDARAVERDMQEAESKIFENLSKVQSVEAIKDRKESKMARADDRMKHLKALIAQARHKSDTVSVAIGPDSEGTCHRVYKWQPIGETTSISFNFAQTRSSNSLLFYWPSSITSDYVAIELFNSQIRASWDLGSGVKVIVHPLKLFTNIEDPKKPDELDHWFHVSYERIGSSVKLQVRKAEDAPTTSSTEEYEEFDDDASTVMDLDDDDWIHIGGLENERREGLVSNGLSGCIHNVTVNHQVLGLWNFARHEGCAACTECSASSVEPPSIDRDYYFTGRGYAVVNRIQSQAFYSKYFDVNMEFRTYAENGLLFLQVNDVLGQSVSIEIRNGQIKFQVKHSWRSWENSIRIETTAEKVNTGKWIKLQALWVFQRGLQTGQLSVSNKQYKQQTQAFDLSLDLASAPYQLGGLSPGFDTGKWQDLISNISFVGCLRNLLVEGNSYNPLSGNYHGVEASCSGKRIHVTSFEGNGFAEYPSETIGKEFRFGFTFKTTFPTGLILFSTFSKSPSPSEKSYYAVYMENGAIRIQIGVNGSVDFGNQDIRYDDGKFHAFRLVRKNRKISWYIDDEKIDEFKFPNKSEPIAAPETHGLFIGGVPQQIQEEFSDISFRIQMGFAGCIQNPNFENKIRNFNHPISHQNQNLGQCPKHFDSIISARYESLHAVPSLSSLHLIPEDQRCRTSDKEVAQESVAQALHFGDSADSHVAISLESSKVFKQRFNLTFHFRTFYPNGLFFQGVRKKGNGDYCFLSYLNDGQIIVKMFGAGSRLQDLVSPVSNLNDGQWHMVSIVKSDQKMYLHVDNKNPTEAAVPKMKPISRIFIGGVPPDGSDCLENSIQKPDNFKGCIKKVVINSHEYNFNGNSVMKHGVNSCFKKVQSGSFFRGESYAVYMYNFTLSSLIELSLEFKTDSRNGDLLSFVPNPPARYPTFSVFLKDGQVYGKKTTNAGEYYEAVETFADNPDYLCNGQWHSIKANFERGAISLKVNSFEALYSLVEPITRVASGSGKAVLGTLFIGGQPDSTALSKQQFYGCIRNISINDKRKDWSDMALLSKVILNSCPAA